jgi:glutathione S-transferase
MKLYGERLPAPNPRRVRIFLAEKGISSIPYEDVPLRKGLHKTPEFKQKNSLGQVPVLELDDGSTLSESVSICRYLEELHPEPVLFGRNAIERARVDMWIRRVELVLMSPISHYWVHAHPLTAALLAQFKDFGESNKERSLKAMRWFDRELDGHAFVVGDSYTMADIVALTSIDFAKFIGIEVPDDYVQLKAWHARVTQRPSAAA